MVQSTERSAVRGHVRGILGLLQDDRLCRTRLKTETGITGAGLSPPPNRQEGSDGPQDYPQNIRNPSVCLGHARVCACFGPWLRMRTITVPVGAALFDIVNVQN